MRFVYMYSIITILVAASLDSCPAATSQVAAYGEWQVTGDVDADGRIAYMATLHERNDKRISMQLKCWPSVPDRGFTFFLFNEAIKPDRSKGIFVTFNNTRLRTVDQFEASGGVGYVDISRMFLELAGCGRCNPRTEPHNGPLLISIQNRKMEFIPAGADSAWGDIAKRCHL